MTSFRISANLLVYICKWEWPIDHGVVGGPCHRQRTSKLLYVSKYIYYDRVIYAHGNGNGNGNGDACVFALLIYTTSIFIQNNHGCRLGLTKRRTH